jgi:hypothetical protein
MYILGNLDEYLCGGNREQLRYTFKYRAQPRCTFKNREQSHYTFKHIAQLRCTFKHRAQHHYTFK